MKTVLNDKKTFVALIGERYFDAITRAIREVDPDHMILGCRFANGYASEGVWQAAGRHCDIVSFNYYGNVDLTRGLARDVDHPRRGKPLAEAFQKFYDYCQCPMMVTEWSFPALDVGLPSIHGAGQRFRTQAERTKATEITARTMLSLPFLVGYDYFMWVDEPAPGVSEKFPEDSNYGLVNEDNKPYELLTAMFTHVHEDASRLRREGLSRAGVATSEPAPVPSRVTAFFAKAPATVLDCGSPNRALYFRRKGEEFSASNGPWEILGRLGPGGLTSVIRYRGLAMGKFNGMVQQYATQSQWLSVDNLIDVKGVVGSAAMTVDLVGRYDAPPQSSQRSFEIAYRLTLLPDRDWFAVQLLSCRNISGQSVDLREIYFLLNSQIDGSAANAPVGKSAATLGHVNGDAWVNAKAKVFWGMVIDDVDLLKVRFWLDEGCQKHPDALIEFELTLGPNETYCPAAPVGMLCVAGRGGQPEWDMQARKVLDALGTP